MFCFPVLIWVRFQVQVVYFDIQEIVEECRSEIGKGRMISCTNYN